MFYCEPCRVKKQWPKSLSGSVGNCECCGEHTTCYDMPSSKLPTKKKAARVSPDHGKVETFWVCPRCKEDNFNQNKMVPCPRGSCEAEVAGEIITIVKLNPDKDE